MYGSLDVDSDTSDTALFAAVAARLPPDALWVTSNLRRTRQTADALVAAGARVGEWREEPDIAELDFGDYNGMEHGELFARRTDPFLGFWPLSPHEQAPNGESFTMLTARACGASSSACRPSAPGGTSSAWRTAARSSPRCRSPSSCR